MGSYEEVVVDRAVDAAWRTFRDRLTEWLLAAGPGKTLMMSVPAEEDLRPYLLVTHEPGSWAISIVADEGLPLRYRFDRDARRALHDLGFRIDEGVPTLHAEHRQVDRIAHATVSVLRDRWGLLLPLGIDTGDVDLVGEPASPTPEVVSGRRDDLDEDGVYVGRVPEVIWPGEGVDLQMWSDRVLGQMLEHPPVYEDDGDIVVSGPRGGRAVVSFRPDGGGVEVWTVLATSARLKKAHAAADRLSRRYRGVRFFLDQDRLVASVVLETEPFVPAHLLEAVRRLCRVHAKERALDLELRRRRAQVSGADVDEDLGMLFSSIWTKGVDADRLARALSRGDVPTLRRWELVAQRMAARYAASDSTPEVQREPRRLTRAKWLRVERVAKRVRAIAEQRAAS